MGIEAGFFIGAVILMAALLRGVWSYNRRNRVNEPVTEKATRELYADPDSYGAKEGKLRGELRP